MTRPLSQAFKASLLGVLCFVACMGAAEPQSPRPIDKFAWLVGGTWTADATKLGGGMKQITTQYQWAPNKSYIQFSTTFTSSAGSVVRYSGTLYASAASPTSAPSYHAWYMDDSGQIVEGPIALGSGNNWSLAFDEGKQSYKVDIDCLSPDHYRWTLSEQSTSTWTRDFSLDYVRA